MQRDWARDDDLFDTSYVVDPYAISDELPVRELHSAEATVRVGTSFRFTVLIG
jgi:hypothetical protein